LTRRRGDAEKHAEKEKDKKERRKKERMEEAENTEFCCLAVRRPEIGVD
jgi:hypothetical protein